MKRYFIRIGDKTTTGGTVTQGEDFFKHDGKAVAYEGAEVYCNACASVGRIANVPPFHTMLLVGKQVALENDICICNCDPPPRLIASQSTGSMSFEHHEPVHHAFHIDGNPLATSSESSSFDDRFKLFDEATGKPLANTEYAILRANGDIEHGVTDRSGRTHLLSSTANSEVVHIYA
ncbi:PAAR domain-containing protein [Burkholderia anthina]|uniref:PAAR domain-containing protein n=1 Tax=Burkholderia anthina TaxID=179879 RepID=UPI0015888CFD|nr:PAAR domain-containing protein [Burkholderia anthina]